MDSKGEGYKRFTVEQIFDPEIGFHVFHKFILHRFLASQIHVSINRCGLDSFVTQAILYIRKTFAR